jgi:hypothetical protein
VAEPSRQPATDPGVAALRWLALFLVPFLVLAVVHWDWAPSATAGDYAQYLLHARALVEGRGYGDIGYIYHPAAGLIGPPVLPPGLPLTLAPLVALGGVHSPLVRLLMIVSVVTFAALAAWRLAREVEPWQAALGSAFAAYAMEASLNTLGQLSDPGFAALLWGTVLAVDRDGPWTWRRVAGVTALGFATMAYRTAGIALIPGLLLFALLRRRALGPRPFVPAAVWTAAGGIGLAAGVVSIPFAERILRSISDLGRHLSTFAQNYRIAPFEAELYPFTSDRANDVYHVIASVLVLIGLALILWRARRTFLVPLAAAYAVMLLVAPVSESRYAWPFYPLLGASLALGTTVVVLRLAAFWRPRIQTFVAAGPLVLILLLALARDARRPAPASLVRHPDALALFAWLAERSRRADADTVPSLRLAFHNPRVVTLETRVPAMGLVPRTPPGQMAALLRVGATHLIWQGTGLGPPTSPRDAPCVQRVANRLPDLYPDDFTLEYQNLTFRVYRVQRGAGVIDGVGEPISWTEC